VIRLTWVSALQELFFLATVLGGVAVGSSLQLLTAVLRAFEPNSYFKQLGLDPLSYSQLCAIMYLKVRLRAGDSPGNPTREGTLPDIPAFPPVLCLLVRSQVSLSDFLTVFASRTTGPFWERKPAPILVGAFVVATSISTCLAMFWPFGTSKEVTMASISPKHALYTWIFCIVWFLIQDVVKVLYLKTRSIKV
jgi:H+-transporting ATPase